VGVTRGYGERIALDDVHLSLDAGELVFLVGPSGAGKTTLLKLINREIHPSVGEVWVDGIPAHTLPARNVAELRRRVGVVFQDYKLLPRLTALENVAFALQVVDLRVSDDEAHDRALDALEAVGLGDRADAFPHQLSGGQQQRVAIARALINRPALVLADEPTGAVDSETSQQLIALMRRLNTDEGVTFVLVTHDHELALRADRVITVRDGRVIADQATAEMAPAARIA